jgi:predicted RNA binding protein YcfA (HicA-like mRNA interferase family)
VKATSGKQLCRLLEDRGRVLGRVSGSHHIDWEIRNSARISIPVNSDTPP